MQHNDSLFKLTDNDGKIVRETSFKGDDFEPWGIPEFEYYYSRPLNEVKEYRK